MLTEKDMEMLDAEIKNLARTKAVLCACNPEVEGEVLEFIQKKVNEYEEKYRGKKPIYFLIELMSEIDVLIGDDEENGI